MSLSHEIVIPIDLTGAMEFAVYAPPESDQVVIEKITLVPGASEGLEAVNFTTIQILDKGADGAQNDEIVSLSTEDVSGNVALVANVKQNMSPSAPYILSYGITIKKADASAAVDLTESSIILKVRQV